MKKIALTLEFNTLEDMQTFLANHNGTTPTEAVETAAPKKKKKKAAEPKVSVEVSGTPVEDVKPVNTPVEDVKHVNTFDRVGCLASIREAVSRANGVIDPAGISTIFMNCYSQLGVGAGKIDDLTDDVLAKLHPLVTTEIYKQLQATSSPAAKSFI